MILDSAHFVVLAAALLAGFVRGFAGFGAALLFVPLASAAFHPQVAAPVLLVTDFVLTAPMLVAAIPEVRWRTVLPAAGAALVTSPAGAYVLLHGDPVTLRWGISLAVLALLVLMASGWRYHGAPRPLPSVGVGAAAGFLSGVAQVGGPPIIAYWVSGPDPARVIRANMFAFFAIITLASATAYLWNGFFTREVGILSLIVAPAYAAALFLGGRAFRRSDGAAYRPLAFAVIALAALTSMPVFDGMLR